MGWLKYELDNNPKSRGIERTMDNQNARTNNRGPQDDIQTFEIYLTMQSKQHITDIYSQPLKIDHESDDKNKKNNEVKANKKGKNEDSPLTTGKGKTANA